MKKLIAANWKENPETEQDALKLFMATANIPRERRGLAGTTTGTTVVVCPPFIYLEEIAKQFRGLRGRGAMTGIKKDLALGGQDIFWERTGAFTGEIGPTMLKSLGASYTIIGHSERRRLLNETDAMINKKVTAALGAGLKVILCVGESLEIRKQGSVAAMKFVKGQLTQALKGIKKKVIIAYEPIWAIGTGKNCPPVEAGKMALFIKFFFRSSFSFSPQVLYGGSVNGKDAGAYLKNKEIDGALVGGASLNAKEFAKIINVKT